MTESAIRALRQLAKGSARTKIARLRELFEEVEAARDAGVTYATIVQTLRQEGLEFDVRTLEVTLSRIRKERERKSATTENGVDTQTANANKTEKISSEVTRNTSGANSLSNVTLNSDLSLTDEDYESFKTKE